MYFQAGGASGTPANLYSPLPPPGPWNVGHIRRLENGEVSFTKTLEMPLEGIENAWHPTKIDFLEFELVNQFDENYQAKLWHVKHPRFNEKPIFMKTALWASSWSKSEMEDETRAYQLINGHGNSPEFLGHVTYHGAIIGFILEWIEGGRVTKKRDESARIKVVKKLHALGITHGSAHHENFLKRGKDVLMIDFESAKFSEEATEKQKKEDIRRIKDFERDFLTVVSEEDAEDDLPYVSTFFDPMIDDEIDWTDDSDADYSDAEDSDSEDESDQEDDSICSCQPKRRYQDSVQQDDKV